jgi:cysteine synthase A
LSLVHDEGLNVGLSTGVNVAGAMRMARKLGPGKTIVTVLCDPGTRYQTRLFNPEFLRSKGLLPPAWLEQPQSLEPDLL